MCVSRLLASRGGYEIYLTHGLFVSGPLTLLGVTTCKSVNICLMLAATLVSTYLLIRCSDYVQRFIKAHLESKTLDKWKE